MDDRRKILPFSAGIISFSVIESSQAEYGAHSFSCLMLLVGSFSLGKAARE
jgi:hypothetical protein